MADRLQYPIKAANDPEGISDPLRDELQWFQPFSEPVRLAAAAAFIAVMAATTGGIIDPEALGEGEFTFPEPISPRQVLTTPPQTPGFFSIDPETLGDPLGDKLEWFQELSVPVLPEHQTRLGLFVTDPTTLDEGLRDELQWFQEFSVPVLPEHQTSPGWFTIDSEISVGGLHWFKEFSLPVLPKHQVRPGLFVIDPATLDDPLRDELQWFQEFSVPVLPPHLFQPAIASVVDPKTIAEVQLDEIQWFQPLSQPVRRTEGARYASALAASGGLIDYSSLGAEVITLDEYQPFSEPTRIRQQSDPGFFSTDPETLSESQRDELQWFQEFSIPILPRNPEVEGANVIVFEPTAVVDDPNMDWLTELYLPQFIIPDDRSGWTIIDPVKSPATGIDPGISTADVFHIDTRAVLYPAQASIDPTALDEGLRDELQWFVPFSEPMKHLPVEPPSFLVDDFNFTVVVVPDVKVDWIEEDEDAKDWTEEAAEATISDCWEEEDVVSNAWTEEDEC